MRYVPELPGPDDDADQLAPRVLAMFGRYLRLVRVDASDIPEQLPEDPLVLSHLVAATANLTLAERQQLLATDDTATRLRKYVLRSKVSIDELPAAIELPQSHAYREHDWRLAGIRAGLPQVYPQTHEAFVAQMLNLDLLGGVSFEKGCYTGQEIIARTHFRGAVKRRMFRFESAGPPPAPATRIVAGIGSSAMGANRDARARACSACSRTRACTSGWPSR